MITTRDELRAAQAPLKQQYRDDPASALTPISAAARYTESGITATVETWSAPVRAGLHRAVGGDGSDACSADMLMEAVVACASVTLRSVATAMGLTIRSGEIRGEGVFDARGTLGVDRTVEVGVQDVRLVATFDTDATDAELEKLASVADRYCVVAQSLRRPPHIEVRRA
ncbi:OsmC family protein [Sinomonas sp. ASV486]|uniref:OsmC family protein n=1 Tax=Sinomonas sp. ASV486 TaxID=3051170 RepID=UPI0027DBE373|nr:OsmC family protein [Sinomonas sp. ASV486]MDQ4491333.1 OsmC family protein [Sinomonas sp. ASV486]